MDKIIVNEKSYSSNEYLEYSRNLGGEVSRANILFLLKTKGHSVSLLKKPKGTDLILDCKKNNKKIYIEDSIYSMYSEKMSFDPILDIESVQKIERKWKIEAAKKIKNLSNKDIKKINFDFVEIKKFKSSSVEINEKDVLRQFKKNRLKI